MKELTVHKTLLYLAQEEAMQRIYHKKQHVVFLDKISNLIKEFCLLDPKGKMPRQKWQTFCFQHLTHKKCNASPVFSAQLNQAMSQLGFAPGWTHTKIGVYRGITWKSK